MTPVIKYSLNTQSPIALNHKCPLSNQPMIATPVQKNRLQQFAFFGYSDFVVAKSTAEPRNSNLYKANSTPKACFFIRSTRTPKERLELLESPERQSMVACNRKGFALCCIPCIAVFEPITRYRQSLERKAVALINQIQGLSKMTTYLFAGIVRTDLSNKIHTLRIEANSLLEAKSKLAKTHVLVLIGKLHNSSRNQVAEVANA